MVVSHSALPSVLKLKAPLAGAVQTYQMEAPPMVLGTRGSPTSAVAPTLLPEMTPLGPWSGWAAAKLSFAGWAKAATEIRVKREARARRSVLRVAEQGMGL